MRRAHPVRRAFTLVETVISASLAVVVLVGLQAAVFVASKAVPANSSAAAAVGQVGAMDRMSADLNGAINVQLQGRPAWRSPSLIARATGSATS